MKPYIVRYKEDHRDENVWVFKCMAEDREHAIEQCRDAYPVCVPRSVQLEHQPNVRFWTYAGDGLVKITLKPGQTLNTCQSGPTDEGWFLIHQSWEYDTDDMVIKWSIANEGKDCDGRHGDYRDFECRIDHLRVYPAHLVDRDGELRPVSGVLLPKWEKAGASQFDHYAELSGY